MLSLKRSRLRIVSTMASSGIESKAPIQASPLSVHCRWLDITESLSKRFYDKHIRDITYDPSICPWTGAECPGGS